MLRSGLTALTLTLSSGALAVDDPLVLQQLSCRGNEPFWSVEINRTTALVSRLLDGPEERIYTGALIGLDFLEPPWAVFQGRDADGQLVVTTRAERCLDTMADLPPFDRRAVVAFADGVVATGCCTATLALDVAAAPPADPAAKPTDDWSRFVLDLATPVRACIVDGGVPVDRVTVAWPMNHGMAGIRLQDAEGNLYDCIAEIGTGRIDRVDAVAAGDRLPQEGQPVLLPARDAPPLLTCGHAETVHDPASGAVLGWLHYGGPCG